MNGSAPFKNYSETRLFAVRWTRELSFAHPEEYAFMLSSDDGPRFFIEEAKGENAVVDNAPSRENDKSVQARTGTVSWLDARRYRVKVEYYQETGAAGCIWPFKGPDTGGMWQMVP